ncbi:RNA polymerase sigma factor [Sporosarcina sp. Marseille-Q4063]|uniref:RNA polymerase sigma factor n=1 Tax=Sporosarcina sp. Marseille-Q4063 TaxID=2810514 RepID=UPI001BB0A1C1|nr:RNA polymerase sigma factor [Sporosarcina sp. Marseille-Q4063]QUW21088.1 RNA polymerase sigma factor [Sporosarcina sp. Marseille-Q4063]
MSSEKWFDDYFGSVYSYILLQVKDPHTAEDLTQETFLKVVRNEHQFKGQSSIKTWIFRIAYTTTMSYFRKKNPLSYFIDLNLLRDDTSPEKIALLNSQQKQFYEALRELKSSYQQVIILRRIEGFSTKETSSILNWSEGKVKMSLSRALAAFKKELEKGGFTNESLI